MMESQSTNIVYLNDDVDYQSLCGSTALASTLARSSVPGLRWTIIIIINVIITMIIIIGGWSGEGAVCRGGPGAWCGA